MTRVFEYVLFVTGMDSGFIGEKDISYTYLVVL